MYSSGRVWSASSFQQTGNYHTWDNAMKYCNTVNSQAEGGYTNWRPATIVELRALNADNGYNNISSSDVPKAFWSSTTKGNKAYAEIIAPPTYGSAKEVLSLKGSGFDAICVR